MVPIKFELTAKIVFFSGCCDLLHSGHIGFFQQAAKYDDLYFGRGSDETILNYKGYRTLWNEQDRIFMVKAIRFMKDAYINAGSSIMVFVPTECFLNFDMALLAVHKTL